MERATRPPAWQEAVGYRLFLALSPRLADREQSRTPAALEPYEPLSIPRHRGSGVLSGTWFPAAGRARGSVLLVPPWVRHGSGYFHRRGRLQALRCAGYQALTIDLPGFGGSGPTAGFFDRDVADAIAALELRSPGLPIHLWGVSAGGYWSHPALVNTAIVAGGFFEDVSTHLLRWAWRMAPLLRPCYLFFRLALPKAYRFLELGPHARKLQLRAAAYVSGAEDPGVLAAETRQLAEQAGAEVRIIPGAHHLGSIKMAKREIHELALRTFARAEGAAGR